MKIIGISGLARSGKDTFVAIARKILEKNGYNTKRKAFADELKNDIDPWLKDKYGISAWTTDNKEKELIRPFLVVHGGGKRIQTEGKYWIDIINKQLLRIIPSRDNFVVFVSDVRFPNEAKWIQESWQGNIIHIKRFTKSTKDGEHNIFYDKAPNEEEAKQDPLVEEISNVKIEWQSRAIVTESIIDDEYLNTVVFETLNSDKLFNGKLIR